MKLIKTKFTDGPKILKTNIFRDNRGFLKETFQNKIFKDKFPFDIMSFSKKNVLRGLHLQTVNSQAKLITVTYGKIFDVAVDLRKNSKTFSQHISLTISHDDDFSFYIPEGFAHGFVCLSDKCTINYKCSNYRHSKSERTIFWDDKRLNIKWPIKKPILSEKDKKGLKLTEFEKKYL
jgi:dTDP-4-dehydrorhamnose 3,5-epimerase